MPISQYAKRMQKQRVTVTVDKADLEEANAAVSEGRARSVSEWVSDAMAQRRIRDRRLAVLGELISEYEAEHGVISDEEIAQQAQQDRDQAATQRAAAPWSEILPAAPLGAEAPRTAAPLGAEAPRPAAPLGAEAPRPAAPPRGANAPAR